MSPVVSPFRAIGMAIAAQRGHLLCWAPICLALGIGGYFSMPVEPARYQLVALLLVLMLLLASLRRIAEDWRPLMVGLILVLAGFLLAGQRAYSVAEPVLGYRYYGPIEGRVISVDRSGSGAVRLTLDRVVLKRMNPARTPARVRVSLHGTQGFVQPVPGLTVILTGHLSPPSGPVEPGGYDFQRHAWFDRLGGVGYTRTPVLGFAAAQPDGPGLWVTSMRLKLSAWVQRQMPGPAGTFATAVMTGDRSALGQGALEDLRSSNLAHLLAISGLHMGLLTGFVFSMLRYGLALIPGVALRWPVKKIAAIAALCAGAGYLALSGGNVATERAFVMVSVMFVAVLLDRRAVTLRAVAVAAIIVLVLRPEVLPEPGFQMSFSATTALVAVFALLRNRRRSTLPKWTRPILAVVISSAVAGFATAPFAAAHFNRFADYGLLANLMSVPLMGLIVMPGAVLAACLAPFGLGWIGLAIMRPAILWILGVANWVAGLEGALTYVPSPGVWVLPLMSLGFLWAVLWQGARPVRLGGLVPVMLAFLLWGGAQRPQVLIADTGGLVGVLGEQGRALSKARGSGFAARSWLENDGDGAGQAQAFERAGFDGVKGDLTFEVSGKRFLHLTGRGASDRLANACARADVVIVSVKADGENYPCMVFDPKRLAQTGAMAVLTAGAELKFQSARQVSGNRLWNSYALRRAGFWP